MRMLIIASKIITVHMREDSVLYNIILSVEFNPENCSKFQERRDFEKCGFFGYIHRSRGRLREGGSRILTEPLFGC